ncbi:hypothetical protein C0993_012169 [Termitomyces sp. T159_Od127]|nr:hypothetical protein C0993_012169 [Termitomyces sp. T159_Od127]
MADEFNAYAPIVVIPGTPERPPQLPQFELNDDPSQVQDWSTSSNVTYNKDTLRLQILSYQPQSSPYLNSPVSPTPYLSSPMSSTSSALSMSPGLTTAFGDFTLADELVEDPYPWNLEPNISHGQSSLSSGGSTSSEGLHLTIPAPNEQLINMYSTPEEDLDEMFNYTISVNFDESSNTVDHDPSPSQTDLGPYLSPQSSKSTSTFLVPHSPTHSVPSTLTGTDLFTTTSNDDEVTLQGHYPSSSEIPRSPLLPSDVHEDDRQLCHHNRSHSNSSVSSSVGGPFSSSLLAPNVMTESNGQPLQRRHSHSSGSQKAIETQGQPRRAKSVHNRDPYPRPQVTGPADAYPTPTSVVDHRKFCDTRTPELSAPPSPLPPSSHSRNVQQSTEDMFRRYDNASAIGYPILQRDTIASDAVLQASAKRRKKIAMYQCPTCGQMLTSRDNLNSTLLYCVRFL